MSLTSDPPRVKRVLLVVNPGARSAAAVGEPALQAFARAKVPCEVMFTAAPGHGAELALTHGSRYDAIFTLGGDGTAMEVVSALADAGSSLPVGILPGGTGNILARAFRIPLDVPRAVHALLHGEEKRIDLGRLADGRHFAIGLGVGVDEAMIAGSSYELKQRIGLLAYVWSATKATFRPPRFRVRLTVDGVTHERTAILVMIMNLGTVPVLGSVLRFGPGITPDDGVLTACVFSPENLFQATRVFARITRGTAYADPAAFFVSGRQFTLETDPPRRAQADGELLGATPLEISVRPGAARLLIPAPKDPRSS